MFFLSYLKQWQTELEPYRRQVTFRCSSRSINENGMWLIFNSRGCFFPLHLGISRTHATKHSQLLQHPIRLIASLVKEVMFSVPLVCLSVCLFVLFVNNIAPKSYQWIGMKFYGEVLGSTMKNIKFWWWSGYSKMTKWGKKTHNSSSITRSW